MRKLILIPARAGSVGLPGKNVKQLHGKPLIGYSIEFAQQVAGQRDVVCVSSNDNEALEIARGYGVDVPFIRPSHLAIDEIGTYEVIMHALEYFGPKNFDAVLLLQPTSPLRRISDYLKLEALFKQETDMIVTVTKSKENPYFNLFEENADGTLKKSKSSGFTRRQDCPVVYAMNGSMYLINVESLLKMNIQEFSNIHKIEVPEELSIDIDTMQDWIIAEYLMAKNENN
jgi:CMP-N,N'-diacetyllegionaminic acid synthase